MDFPDGLDDKESACDVGDLGLIPGFGKNPWRREWLAIPVFFAGEFHGQRSLTSYSPWGHKEWDMPKGLAFSLPLYHIGIILKKKLFNVWL